MVGAVGELASMKRCKLWKMGEGGLCCSSSVVQTRLGPSSLLEERSKISIVFKRPDTIGELLHFTLKNVLKKVAYGVRAHLEVFQSQ